MNSKSKLLRCALALAALVAIGGCGGGGGGGGNFFPIATTPPATTTPPPPASQSPYEAFIAYMKEIVQTALDTAEPVDVLAFDPAPTSEVLEPVALQ